jgi:hypothetical protein
MTKGIKTALAPTLTPVKTVTPLSFTTSTPYLLLANTLRIPPNVIGIAICGGKKKARTNPKPRLAPLIIPKRPPIINSTKFITAPISPEANTDTRAASKGKVGAGNSGVPIPIVDQRIKAKKGVVNAAAI